MIAHNADYTTDAQAPAKTMRVTLTQVVDDDPLTFASDDDLMSVKIDTVGTFLGIATKKATVKLLDIHDELLQGLYFNVQLGILNPDDDTWDDITLGKFMIDEVALDYDAGGTTMTLYDDMYTASNILYASTDFAYPCTVQQLAQAVAVRIGVELQDGFDVLPNYDYTITQDLYATINNFTLGNVINEIAQATGTTAILDSEGKLKFVQFVDSGETMTSSNLKTLKLGTHYGAITSVVLSRQPQEDNITLGRAVTGGLTITAVDTGDDLLTIVGNNFSDGSMIRITSDGDMPAGIVEGESYYIFTGGDPDTFSLHSSYEDAVAGTSPVDVTSTGTGTIETQAFTTQELKIANNEIMDDERAVVIVPLYNTLANIEFDQVNSKTEGHGWYEVGDVITITQGSASYRPFITEIHLILEGSIDETIICTPPDPTQTNMMTAGGILKTIYNTEIKVDKQANDITSVVEEVSTLGDTVASNYTELHQDIENITLTVQQTGGGNLIKNSVGYSKADDNSFTSWNWDDVGTADVTTQSSPNSMLHGALSGNEIDMEGGASGGTIKQRILTAQGQKYSLSFMALKDVAGDAQVTLSNGTDNYVMDLPDGTAWATWTQFYLDGLVCHDSYFDVKVTVDGDVIDFAITDLMLVKNDTHSAWQQASDEILNSQVTIDGSGVSVKNNLNSNLRTNMTPLEFAQYNGASRTFSASEAGVEASNLELDNEIVFQNYIVKPITSGSKQGLVFVRRS